METIRITKEISKFEKNLLGEGIGFSEKIRTCIKQILESKDILPEDVKKIFLKKLHIAISSTAKKKEKIDATRPLMQMLYPLQKEYINDFVAIHDDDIQTLFSNPHIHELAAHSKSSGIIPPSVYHPFMKAVKTYTAKGVPTAAAILVNILPKNTIITEKEILLLEKFFSFCTYENFINQHTALELSKVIKQFQLPIDDSLQPIIEKCSYKGKLQSKLLKLYRKLSGNMEQFDTMLHLCTKDGKIVWEDLNSTALLVFHNLEKETIQKLRKIIDTQGQDSKELLLIFLNVNKKDKNAMMSDIELIESIPALCREMNIISPIMFQLLRSLRKVYRASPVNVAEMRDLFTIARYPFPLKDFAQIISSISIIQTNQNTLDIQNTKTLLEFVRTQEHVPFLSLLKAIATLYNCQGMPKKEDLQILKHCFKNKKLQWNSNLLHKYASLHPSQKIGSVDSINTWKEKFIPIFRETEKLKNANKHMEKKSEIHPK